MLLLPLTFSREKKLLAYEQKIRKKKEKTDNKNVKIGTKMTTFYKVTSR